MSPGYAGIANDLFSDPRTGMLFADAKQALADITVALKQYVTA
jgi:NAD(P) transhydrogenase subunit beta